MTWNLIGWSTRRSSTRWRFDTTMGNLEYPKVDFDKEDGGNLFMEDNALACLLIDGLLDVSEDEGGEIVPFVGCNDIFAWGCADAEGLPYDQIESLYREWSRHPIWGATRWCIKQRGCQPQPPVKRDMIRDGAWDDELEKLKKNGADKT